MIEVLVFYLDILHGESWRVQFKWVLILPADTASGLQWWRVVACAFVIFFNLRDNRNWILDRAYSSKKNLLNAYVPLFYREPSSLHPTIHFTLHFIMAPIELKKVNLLTSSSLPPAAPLWEIRGPGPQTSGSSEPQRIIRLWARTVERPRAIPTFIDTFNQMIKMGSTICR